MKFRAKQLFQRTFPYFTTEERKINFSLNFTITFKLKSYNADREDRDNSKTGNFLRRLKSKVSNRKVDIFFRFSEESWLRYRGKLPLGVDRSSMGVCRYKFNNLPFLWCTSCTLSPVRNLYRRCSYFGNKGESHSCLHFGVVSSSFLCLLKLAPAARNMNESR